MPRRYVYTLSSRGKLPNHCLHSIKSLLHWVDAKQVIVFFTPPINTDHINTFERLGVNVRRVNNITEEFYISPFEETGHYGEKIRVCSVDASEVMFLDCDTLIYDDPSGIFTDEFDIKMRSSTFQQQRYKWDKMFDHYDCEMHDWMPNTGVIAFKHGVHKQIQADWRHYMNEDLVSFFPQIGGMNLTDQWALALSIGDYQVEKMSKREHLIEWDETLIDDSIIYHFDQDPQSYLDISDILSDPIWFLNRLYEIKIKRFLKRGRPR